MTEYTMSQFANRDDMIAAMRAEIALLRAALDQIVRYADGSTDPGIVRVAREALNRPPHGD